MKALKAKPEESRAEQQARAQLASIVEMVEAVRKAEAAEDDGAREEAITAIYEDPLSVEVRSGWHTPGDKAEPAEYRIMLCWGGPAVMIQGSLDGHGPQTADLFYQDWGTPWTELLGLSDKEREALEYYAHQFVFET